MSNTQSNEKETLEQFYVGEFATPKKLNRSTKNIPDAIIQSLENGDFTTEMINDLSKKFPIFIYKSCITIHGTFGIICRTSVGGYQNIRQNANGSLEILYSAIDRTKIDTINLYLRAIGKNTIKTDSKGHTYMKKFATIELLRDYCKSMREMKGLVCSVFAFRYNGGYYVELSILSIKQTEMNEFLQVITGCTSDSLDVQLQAYEKQQAEQKAVWDKKMEQAQIQRNEAEARKQANLAPLIAKIAHMPKVTTIEVGRLYVQAGKFEDNGCCFRFTKFEKAAFGRVKQFHGYSTDLTPPVEMTEGKSYTKKDAVEYNSKMQVFTK